MCVCEWVFCLFPLWWRGRQNGVHLLHNAEWVSILLLYVQKWASVKKKKNRTAAALFFPMFGLLVPSLQSKDLGCILWWVLSFHQCSLYHMLQNIQVSGTGTTVETAKGVWRLTVPSSNHCVVRVVSGYCCPNITTIIIFWNWPVWQIGTVKHLFL